MEAIVDNFKIREYLDANFSRFSKEDLVSHFMLKFGVNVSNEEDLYLFKYNQISANWNEEITYECRGLILRHTDAGWKYVSIPFYKFFNLSEGKCPWFNIEKFAIIKDKLVFAEKIDGSCIQVWYDDVKNIWRASTLGSISTANVFDHPFTFSELFWKLYNKKGNDLSTFKVGYTYIFELWTMYNQVVSQYSEDSLVLLGVRNIETFSLDDFTVENAAREFSNIKAPQMYVVEHIKTQLDVENWVEEMSLREDLFGRIPEGFVGWIGGVPCFKQKNKKYNQYHRIITGDKIYVLKNIISAVFCGNVDDIYGDLNKELQEFVDRLKLEISRVQNEVLVNLSAFKGLDLEDKKGFALKVQELTKSNKDLADVTPFFFQNRDKILKNEVVDISEWLVEDDRYLKYLEKWKVV